MKLFYRLTLLFISLSLITACSEDKFDIEPILVVHEEALVFSNIAGAQNVAVDKNEGDKLLCSVNSDISNTWIDVTTTNEGLNIAVQDNNTFEERIATIKVLLEKGSKSAYVNVTQAAGGEAYISASKDNFDFTYKENAGTFFIKSNVEWTFSVDAADKSWLTVDDAEKAKNKLSLTTVENTTNKRRVATITLDGDGEKYVINVVQRGTIYFDFPFLDIGYRYHGAESERGMLYPNSYKDAYAFEVARGNSFSKYQGTVLLHYKSKSPIFPILQYEVYDPSEVPVRTVRQVILESSIPPLDLLEDPEFLEHLEYEGYEFAWKNDTWASVMYWNKEKQLSLHLSSREFRWGETVMFMHCRLKPNDPDNQVDEYKTFDAMPTFYTEWGATVTQIMAWEEARGSTFLPEDSYGDIIVSFSPDPSVDPGIIERTYTLDRSTSPTTLLNTTILLNELEMIFYNSGFVPDHDSHILTREFTTLVTQDGYVYDGQGDMSIIHHYLNVEKGNHMEVYMRRFVSEGYMPRGCIQVHPIKK